MTNLIHTQEKKSQDYKGTEHLGAGRNVFDWRVKSAAPTGMNAKQAHAEEMRLRWHAKKNNMSFTEYKASVMRVNPYSEVAMSTRDAGLRAAHIRKGGVM